MFNHKLTLNSAEMIGSDKENQGVDLSVSKKRAKVDASGPTKTMASRVIRNGPRKINPSTVLSPKSHNSRTLPNSPLKAAPTANGAYLHRPASPAKPTPTAHATMGPPPEKAKSTRQRVATKASATSTATSGSVRGKKGVATSAAQTQPTRTARTRAVSNSSASSSVSTTTVVNKKTNAKKGIIGKVTGMATAAGRKAAAAKKEATASSESGRRVLRARK
jgi:hypothetical protein